MAPCADTIVASAADLDAAMTEGIGLHWALLGPLEIMNVGGLDVFNAIGGYLFHELNHETEGSNMSAFNQMTLIGILVLIGVLLIAGMVAISSRSSRSASPPLRAGIIAQSKEYIETLGTKPFGTLNTTQKLLVLHAYYNLGKYQMVTQRAETMIEALRQLSPERKQAFSEIVEDAYRQLEKDQHAVAFKHRIGL